MSSHTPSGSGGSAGAGAAASARPGWYPDPWRVAPHRWWDGGGWTPILRGPYGEAWPAVTYPAGPIPRPPFQPKGPGIQGGGVAAVGAAIGYALSSTVAVSFAVASSGRADLSDPWLLLTSQTALWIGFVGAVVVASRKNGSSSLAADYGLSWPRLSDLGLGLGGGAIGRMIPTLLALLLALAGGLSNAGARTAPTILGARPRGDLGWAVVVVLAVVGAPLVEELLFRGLIQGAFTRRTGAVPAIFITALIFSFAHIFNEGPAAPLLIFPSGVILGYLRYRTGRLAAGMIAHATFNASLFVVLLIPVLR